MLKDFKQGNKFEFATDPSQCFGHDMREVVKELNGYLTKLGNLYTKEQDNFAELCYYVFKINEFFSFKNYKLHGSCVYTKDRKQIRFRDIMDNIGIDETQSSRLLSCYEKFVIKEDKPRLLAEFFGFSKSKLFELLGVPVMQLQFDITNKVLRVDMSVAQIRAYVKNYKARLKADKKLLGAGLDSLIENIDKSEEEIKEEDIPEAYNPKKHYDFSYFETKNKAQLLNIVWSLQEEYERLKNKNKK